MLPEAEKAWPVPVRALNPITEPCSCPAVGFVLVGTCVVPAFWLTGLRQWFCLPGAGWGQSRAIALSSLSPARLSQSPGASRIPRPREMWSKVSSLSKHLLLLRPIPPPHNSHLMMLHGGGVYLERREEWPPNACHILGRIF